MNVEYHCKYDKLVSPDELKPHPKNANMHPEEQIEALCRFIRVSGWRQVITVSKRSGFIVAGMGRRLAAKKIGCDVPVVYQDFETEVDEIAYLLADNRLAELAITDDDALQSGLDFLEEEGFSLDDIGFESLDYAPPVVESDKLNDNPGQRMNRNDGAREVVAVGRFIGAASKELTLQLVEKLESIDDPNAAAEMVCKILIERL
jgi:ParB-like chromosome segregation protein Spo0J